MSIDWKMKSMLAAKHNIYTARELQKLIVKKTGVLITVANLCNYIHKKPKRLNLETIELIVSSLGCALSDFCDVKPKEFRSKPNRKLGAKYTPKSKIGKLNFPDPRGYCPE